MIWKQLFAKKSLETTKAELATASEKADQQEKRANDLAGQVDKLTQQRNEAIDVRRQTSRSVDIAKEASAAG